MKRDKKWFVDKLTKKRDRADVHDPMYYFINELIADVNQLDEPEVLPVIPKCVAEYLELAKSDVSLKRVMELANTRYELPRWEKEYDWISENSETFARAWLDGYEVEEEPLYCALVKGHEIMVDDDTLTFKYWNYDTFNGDLFPSNRFSRDGRFLIEMRKSEWNKLGIDGSNADFVKVNE